MMILISSALYMIALYQIDYKWDSIQNVLAYSAKRFLFCFVPMAWFYAMSNNWNNQNKAIFRRYMKKNINVKITLR